MVTLKRALVLTVALAAFSLVAAACGDDDAESDSSAQQSDVETINSRIQQNEVMFALKAVGDIHLHDMNAAIDAGEVEGDFLPNARAVIRYVGLTDWPDSLEEDAMAIEDAAIDLVTALDSGDNDAAKAPSAELHDLWHQFDVKAWDEIGGDLPPEAGTSGGGHDDSGTPAADGTAADDHNSETPVSGGTPAGDDH